MDEFKEVDVSTNTPSTSPQRSATLVMEECAEKPPITCPSVSINTLTINGGYGHIGNNYKTVTNTENLILNITSLEEKVNGAEAQVIRSIQTNLESELSYMRACDKNMSLITKVVVPASVLLIIFAIVFAATVGNHQHGDNNLSKFDVSDNVSYCDGICNVSRQQWGAKWTPHKGATYCAPLKATSVKVDLWFSVCVNIEQCSKAVRGVQDRLPYKNSSRVSSLKNNFVIGGDKRYYIGRAWDCGWENLLSTAIIFNDYTFVISERQTYLFQLLIHTGRKCGFVNRGFKFIINCGFYCYSYMEFERIANMTRQDLYLVRDYQTFLQDSEILSKNECENSTYSCKIRGNAPYSMYIIDCSFPEN